ncbi:hypothetical protein [Qipengyuania aquimaris]|uniref:hypothetical protein n=1 Tax=Qipengyuania aquimaris TaxID=255984 RepID=UPI001FD047DC|nr:hypothetical protein [Qipengyuania aquimaris]UOR15517.1 hypothetical protein LCM05_00295 [Qipengyuania aquimaris]
MRNLLIVASALAIAACSQAEEAEPVVETTEAAETEAVTLAADGAETPGMYRVTTEAGDVYMEEVKADGTYVTTKDGEVTETGKWEQPSPDQYCTTIDEAYISEDDDGSRKCNTEQIGEDGVWTSVNDKGETAIVERVES